MEPFDGDMSDTSRAVAELWSAGGARLESLQGYAYVVLGLVVLGFVLLELLYVAGVIAFVARWKTTAPR